MHSRVTFDFSELVERLEAGGIEDMVGLERHSEETAVGTDRTALVSVVLRSTKSTHLAVGKVDVEIGKFHVIALVFLVTPGQVTGKTHGYR